VANIQSQIKRNKQNLVRRERNKAVRSELKSRTKSAVVAAETGTDDADERLRAAVKRIDMAAAKGVIHKNQAARRKSRLVARIRKVAAEACSGGRDRPDRRSPVGPGRRAGRFDLPPAPPRQRDSWARRATSTSSTRPSGHALPPRRSRSAFASRSTARTTRS
jgi:small subunit ribosomal protein S20